MLCWKWCQRKHGIDRQFFRRAYILKSGIGKFAQGYIRVVDNINARMGYVSYALPVMTCVMTYEVIARFVFNAPTIWAWDINEQLLAFIAVTTGGFVLFHKGHTRMDMFSSRWSVRRHAYVHTFTYLFGVIFLGALLAKSFDLAVGSIAGREYSLGLLSAPLYPLRVVIVLGIILFLAQTLAEIIRNILVLTSKKGGKAAEEMIKES